VEAGNRGSWDAPAGFLFERGSGSEIQPTTHPVLRRNNPESKLVAALIAGPEWIEHARAEISPALFGSSRIREVFEALLRTENGSSEQLPAGLTDAAAAVWSRLKEAAQGLTQEEVSRIYDSAGQILRARPLYREMDQLTDPGEKRRRREELRAEFPAADAWYVYQKAATGELRKARGSREA
jgi:hypothetical protein